MLRRCPLRSKCGNDWCIGDGCEWWVVWYSGEDQYQKKCTGCVMLALGMAQASAIRPDWVAERFPE